MSNQPLDPGDVYNIIGPQGFKELVDGFYQRIAEDEKIRAMYPEEDLGPANRRLRLFLQQYFGGPPTYSTERGHPRLRMRHMPFKIDQDARDRWVEYMLASLSDTQFPDEVKSVMKAYFERGASFLMNDLPTSGGMFTTQRNSKENSDGED